MTTQVQIRLRGNTSIGKKGGKVHRELCVKEFTLNVTKVKTHYIITFTNDRPFMEVPIKSYASWTLARKDSLTCTKVEQLA